MQNVHARTNLSRSNIQNFAERFKTFTVIRSFYNFLKGKHLKIHPASHDSV